MIVSILLFFHYLAHVNAECEATLGNLMMLIDDSWSIYPSEWTMQTNFLADIVMMLPGDSYLGIVKFGVGIEPIRELSAIGDGINRLAASTQVREMPYGGPTRPCTCTEGIYVNGQLVCSDTGPIPCNQSIRCDWVFGNLSRSIPPFTKVKRRTNGACTIDGGTDMLSPILYALDAFRATNLLSAGRAVNQIILIGDGVPTIGGELDIFCDDPDMKRDLDLTQMIIFGVGSDFGSEDTLRNFDCIGACRESCLPHVHRLKVVQDFDDLSSALITEHLEFCTGTPTQSPTVSPTEPCVDIGEDSTLNVMVLIDGSHSISPEQWTQQVEFAADLVLALPDNSRVGVMKFGTGVDPVRDLDRTPATFNKIAVSQEVRSLELGGYVRPCKCYRWPPSTGPGICSHSTDAEFPCHPGRVSCERLFEEFLNDRTRPVPQNMNAYIVGPSRLNCETWGETHVRDAIEAALETFGEQSLLESHGDGSSWNVIYLTTDGEPHPNRNELAAYDDDDLRSDIGLDSTQIVIFGVGNEFITDPDAVARFENIPHACIVNISNNDQQDPACFTEHKMFLLSNFRDLAGFPIERYCTSERLRQAQADFSDLDEIFMNELSASLVIGTLVIGVMVACCVMYYMYRRKQEFNYKPQKYEDYEDENESSSGEDD